jgi:hypothetical protein
MKQKYVILKNERVIVFDNSVIHSAFKSLHPVSAGFVVLVDGSVEVFGESLSLMMESRTEDQRIIQEFFDSMWEE